MVYPVGAAFFKSEGRANYKVEGRQDEEIIQ